MTDKPFVPPLDDDNNPESGKKQPIDDIVAPVMPLENPVPGTGDLKDIPRPTTDSVAPFIFSTANAVDVGEEKKDTAILSQSSPLLKRLLSHQGVGGTSSLGDRREVILLIRGVVERVVMSEGIQYKLGRFDIATRGDDEIDLSPYGAIDKGVSRIHAALHIQDGRLYLTDLDSTNGTFLAGNRLPARQATVLRKGDEVMIGRLYIQILFR